MDANKVKDSIKNIVSAAVPDITIDKVEAIVSKGLHQMYIATSQSSTQFTCSLSPLPNRRVLRCEYTSIRAEAALLQWIASVGERGFSTSSPSSLSSTDSDDGREEDWRTQVQQLSRFAPKLVEYGSAALPHRTSYNITTCLPGNTISTLSNPLTEPERRSVNFQVGQLIRRISLLVSPTGRFGNAESIMPPVPAKSNWAQKRTVVQHPSVTYARWSEAFTDMLNGAIRDAQSNHITASYDGIRRCLRRFSPILDLVREPRLIIMDAGLDHTLLVRRLLSENQEPSESENRALSSIQVTGMLEWIKSFFGDPLIALVFAQEDRADIFEGFNKPLSHTTTLRDGNLKPTLECSKEVQIKLLLYQVYHSLNAITAEYLRRDGGSDPREMRARKRLLEAIRQLDSIQDMDVPKRRQYLSEASSAKRQKTEVSSGGN